ncbi:MAG TPA: glycosyltransferase [Patescibacteria group bacterium]|nr:glycosyltransferase [Patescibacteria group bacterium]
MLKPRFSVIIPTLNEEKFLPKLLTSLTQQTVKNFEVIVVDASPDNRTIAAAKRFEKSLPITIKQHEVKGVSRQRNSGAKLSKADWLIFIDADSILFPNFIERITRFIDKKHSRFFTTWLKADSEEPGDAIGGFLLNMGIEGSVLIERPWAPGPLTAVRRDVFESVGGYNENVTFAEDHELGVMIYRKGVAFDILREILYIYSFRRFRKEKSLKIFNRWLKSTLSIVFTHKGLKYMPGFIGGGSIYEQSPQEKKKGSVFFSRLGQRIDKVIRELVAS